MKSVLVLQVCVLSTCLNLMPAAHADVQVKFVEPKKFSDIRGNDGFSSSDVLPELEAHFVAQAAKRFPGLDLRFSITDVDLAGEIEPFGWRLQWIRTLRPFTSPSLTLRYEVLSQGRVVRSGEAKLRDMDYLDGFNAYPSGDPLRYERRMIDRWMARELAPALAQSATR